LGKARHHVRKRHLYRTRAEWKIPLRALRLRLFAFAAPMKKVARMWRSHEELILNWFQAKGEISTVEEGLNHKIRVVT